MSNDTPTTVASDWLVSVTPSPRGDWALGNLRYNLTLHNGATVADVLAVLETLAKLDGALVSAYDTPTAPPAHNGGSTPPSTPQRQAPPPPDGADGEDVYNVGWIVAGGQFDVEIERAVKTATGGGKPKLDLYRPGNQYPFATVNENQFDAFHAATGVHGNDLIGETAFNPPKMLRFKVGKKKQKSDKHYIDFVGAPQVAAPASNGSTQAWNRTEVVNALTEKYPKWEPQAINDALSRVDTTPAMSNEQVIAAFNAKVEAVTGPKGA